MTPEHKTKPKEILPHHFRLRHISSSLGIVVIITLINWLLHFNLEPSVLISFYIIGCSFILLCISVLVPLS